MTHLPVFVISSPVAFPRVTAPLRVVAPSTLSVESKSPAPFAVSVPATTVLPVPDATVNLFVATVKFPTELTVPLKSVVVAFTSRVGAVIYTSVSASISN